MKKLKIIATVLFATAIGTGIYTFGTSNQAPQKVKDAFAQKFPEVKKVKWEKESESEWEGEFKMKGTAYSANFLEDGTWQETEHQIKNKDIPENIKITLLESFPDYKIEEAEISESVDGFFYEIEIEKGNSAIEVILDVNGKIIRNTLDK